MAPTWFLRRLAVRCVECYWYVWHLLTARGSLCLDEMRAPYGSSQSIPFRGAGLTSHSELLIMLHSIPTIVYMLVQHPAIV